MIALVALSTSAQRLRRSLLPSVAVLAVLGIGVVVVAAQARAGCDPLARGSIVESASFVPADQQRGPLRAPGVIEPPVRPVVLPVAPVFVPGTVGGLEPVAVYDSGVRFSVLYLAHPIEASMTAVDLYREGGIRFTYEPRDGTSGPLFADQLVATTDGRARPVDIGPYRGAIGWADPSPVVDIRTHNLYWSDGNVEYSLVAFIGPEDLVNLGRSSVCDGD